uniref:Uncharacterized protein n=1 Tax=Pseudomonas phage Cygsa01 TaxID=3138529 RepID=A0AAU6W4U1_9VIRU
MKNYTIPGLNGESLDSYVRIRPRASFTTTQIFLAMDLAAYNRPACTLGGSTMIISSAKEVSAWTHEELQIFSATQMSDLSPSDKWSPAALSWALRYNALYLEGRRPKATNGRFSELKNAIDHVLDRMGPM